MKILAYSTLVVFCTLIAYFSYLTIKDVNENKNLSTKEKNEWVLLVTYIPIFGCFIYKISKKKNLL